MRLFDPVSLLGSPEYVLTLALTLGMYVHTYLELLIISETFPKIFSFHSFLHTFGLANLRYIGCRHRQDFVMIISRLIGTLCYSTHGTFYNICLHSDSEENNIKDKKSKLLT